MFLLTRHSWVRDLVLTNIYVAWQGHDAQNCGNTLSWVFKDGQSYNRRNMEDDPDIWLFCDNIFVLNSMNVHKFKLFSPYSETQIS